MMMMNRLAHPKHVSVRMARVHLADAPAFVLRWSEDLQVPSLAPIKDGIYVVGPDRLSVQIAGQAPLSPRPPCPSRRWRRMFLLRVQLTR
jgi:hypothetical protein